ncbi:MAG TPA: MerR family transcriptional regulator [Solirubrobacteraceae bacterium]|nr:MerR family transcriptional regulator [Solirubrobacteraceae bacterium]
MATQAGLTIADAARVSGVSAYTLRYYERAGLIDGVNRAGSGHRRYSDDDLAWIEVLQCLRKTGMPIAGIRRYAELVRAGDGNEEERLALLEEHRGAVRAQLIEVRRHLEFIERKIAIYEEKLNDPETIGEPGLGGLCRGLGVHGHDVGVREGR